MRKGNKENIKKEFTIRERKDIINKKCALLNKDESFYEREGLYVKLMNNELLIEVTNELNFIEKIFFKRKFIEIYKNGVRKGFNWNNNVR